MRIVHALILICVIASAHAGFYILYQQPDWNTTWTDQKGYEHLGRVLSATGRFTRYPEATTFIPEAIRTPGYPLLLALIYRLFGVDQLPVALAQAVLFAGICILVYLIGRQLVSERVALAAAAATALYSPIPYFGALVMTEVWTTFLLTFAMWTTVRAMQSASHAHLALAGLGLGWTALSRPAFALLPLFLIGAAVVPSWRHRLSRTRLSGWALMLLVFCLTLAPWFAYNYAYFGRFTISPAGGIGRAMWEGYWNGKWSGRLQGIITRTAEEQIPDEDLQIRLRQLARESGEDPELMLRYAREWRELRRIWTEPTEPRERTLARVRADEEYLRAAMERVKTDWLGHLIRRTTHGLFLLWAGEIPVRYSDINKLPTVAIRIMWLLQAGLVGLAIAGLVALARHGRYEAVLVLATPLVYITLVHISLLTEARQSLPGKPILLLLAVQGAVDLSRRLLPLKPKVHKL